VSAKDQPRATEHYSGLGEGPSGHKMEFTEDPSGQEMSSLRTCLKCHEGGGLGRDTTLLLLRSLQIRSLGRLLNQSVRGNHFLYSKSIIVIHTTNNNCTHLSCL
jgi:hypothetical protein